VNGDHVAAAEVDAVRDDRFGDEGCDGLLAFGAACGDGAGRWVVVQGSSARPAPA
jgi:hypothetical protein